MKIRSLFFSVLLLSLLAVAVDYPLAKPQTASNAGKPAPDFTLKDQEGRDFTLSAQRATKVLIVFYRGHWCPYCMAQLKDLAANKARFDKAGVTIVAISADAMDMAKKVHEKAVKRQFTVLSDPDLRVIKAYGLFQEEGINKADIAIRTSVLVDEKGIEVFRRVSATAADIPSAQELLDRIAAGK